MVVSTKKLGQPVELASILIGAFIFWLGVFSLLFMIKREFELEWPSILDGLVDGYEALTEIFFRPLKSWLVAPLIQEIKAYFNIEINLYDHWKHIFVILFAYITRDTAVDLRRERWGAAAFTIVWGFIVAFLGAVVAGTLPLDQKEGSGLLVLTVIISLVIFELVRSLWRATFAGGHRRKQGVPEQSWLTSFSYLLVHVVTPIGIIGSLLLNIFFVLKEADVIIDISKNPTLLFIIIFMILNAGFLVARGGVLALTKCAQAEARWKTFRESGSTQLGLALLLYLGTGCLIALIGVILTDLGVA